MFGLERVSKMGGPGDLPVPVGDSPTGTTVKSAAKNPFFVRRKAFLPFVR
jgi:hypothetical protein